MHEAALQAGEDPDRLSFLHAVGWSGASCRPTALLPPRQKRAFHNAVLDEILEDRVVSSRNRRNPRGIKRKMSSFPLRPRHVKPLPKINIREAIRILK
jgi:hypothetical protein